MTGAIRSSSAPTDRWTSATLIGGSWLSDTRDSLRGPHPRKDILDAMSDRLLTGSDDRCADARVPATPASRAAGRRPVLVAVLAAALTLATLLSPVATRAEAAESGEALKVTISNLDTASLTATAGSKAGDQAGDKAGTKGSIKLSGTITNGGKDTATGVKIYPCMGSRPITDEADLATEAGRPDDAVVCDRIVHEGAYATIPDLAKGDSYTWHISVPRTLLGAKQPGVYWFCVHALGPQSPNVADARARTFLPLVDTNAKKARKTPQKVALVLPLRRQVTYHSDGRLAYVQGWTRELNGRLSDLLAVGQDLPDVTWAIDPALLDAVRKLADGNPPRDTGPTDGSAAPPGSASASPSVSALAMPSDTESADQQQEDAQIGAAAKQAAAAWLKRLGPAVQGRQVLALPYADPDLPALAAGDKGLYQTARKQSQATLKSYGIDAEPAVVPPSGYLDQGAIKLAGTNTVSIVGDDMFKGTAPAVADVGGHPLVVGSTAAASGGPGPGDRTDAVSLRQRIVSQAALRRGTGRPLVVVLPDSWAPPESPTAFVRPLISSSWLEPVSVTEAISGQASTDVSTSRLNYPAHEKKSHISPSRLSAANGLIRSGNILQRVLAHNSTVAAVVAEEAMTTTSYAARGHDTGAAAQAAAVIDAGLRRITVEVPPKVILSNMKGGKFQVWVHNGFNETVTVRLRAASDRRLRVSSSEPIQLDPNSRTSEMLSASVVDAGTHTAQILVSDVDGTPLGGSAYLPIRPAQVSSVIWWFVGTGCALLFAAIAVRLTRRVASARKSRLDGKTPTEAT